MTIDEQSLERKFIGLTDSQESVQTLSLWILHHKNHYKKIIQVWFKILEKDKVSHRLNMFYLMNDVVQHAKKKGYKQYLDGFREVLKKATVLVRDEKIAPKITRIFNIWSERSVYSEEFLTDLRNILAGTSTPSISENSGRKKSSKDVSNTYQHSTTVANRVPTDFSLTNLGKRAQDFDLADKQAAALICGLNIIKIDKIDSPILSLLKDRTAGELCLKELSDIESSLKNAVQALEKKAHSQASLIETLDKCELFYETQQEEVKIVANAYKNFGAKIRTVQSKIKSNENSYLSPIIDAPSPNSDDDLVLPSHDSPLPGFKSLLNVFNENSASNNKVSSLDKRLSNLMQNLPTIHQPSKPHHQAANSVEISKKESKSEHDASRWSSTFDSYQSNVSHIMQQQPLNATIVPQPSHHKMPIANQLPVLGHQAPSLINTHQPLLPPNHPPPFIPAMQADPGYFSARFSLPHNVAPPPIHHQPVPLHHQTQNSPQINTVYNASNNGTSTNSPSVQQIKSVISTRNEQQELSDLNSSAYDPYSVDTARDSFCEPADMDLGDSDEEETNEMNRSSNSQRVLKIIETNDSTSGQQANNLAGGGYMSASNLARTTKPPAIGVGSYGTYKITNLTPNVPPPSLPSNFESSSLSRTTTLAQHHSNFQSHDSAKLYSPVKQPSFHHHHHHSHKDAAIQQYGNTSRSPRFHTNFNNHQSMSNSSNLMSVVSNDSTSSYDASSSQSGQPISSIGVLTNSSSTKNDYSSRNKSNLSGTNTSSNQPIWNISSTHNRNGAWKNQNRNFHNNMPPFQKNRNQQRSFSNSNHNHKNLNNLASVNSSSSNLSNLTSLNPQQHQQYQ